MKNETIDSVFLQLLEEEGYTLECYEVHAKEAEKNGLKDVKPAILVYFSSLPEALQNAIVNDEIYIGDELNDCMVVLDSTGYWNYLGNYVKSDGNKKVHGIAGHYGVDCIILPVDGEYMALTCAI